MDAAIVTLAFVVVVVGLVALGLATLSHLLGPADH